MPRIADQADNPLLSTANTPNLPQMQEEAMETALASPAPFVASVDGHQLEKAAEEEMWRRRVIVGRMIDDAIREPDRTRILRRERREEEVRIREMGAGERRDRLDDSWILPSWLRLNAEGEVEAACDDGRDWVDLSTLEYFE